MRILLAGTGVLPIPPPGYGGVERTIAEYAEALRRAGHSVDVVNEVRGGRSRDEYRFALHLPRLLTGRSYDVLHASTPVVANRLAWAGEPFVYTTHSRHWFDRSGLGGRWGAFLERRAVARAASTVALTDRLRSRLAAQVPGITERLTVIPIGVDSDRFRPDWGRRTGSRALGVGVVRPFKRWEVAAEGLRGTGFQLTVVGPTPDRAYADRVARAGEGVTLAGEVDSASLDRFYAESDLLVHPSQVEVLAGVVLQGLAAGLPVLGADPVGDLLEEGATGFSAPAGADDAGIARSFQDAAQTLARDADRRRRMGEAARASAIRRFAWPRVVDEHIRLYHALGVAGRLTRRRSRAT